jgi:hypothetical protein
VAKPSVRDLTASQWFYVVVPALVGIVVAWWWRTEMEFPLPLYFVGGGFALSLLIGFLMVYGDQL